MVAPLSYWEEPEFDSIISRGASAAIAERLFVVINATEQFALPSAGGEADGVTVAGVSASTDKISAYTRGAVLVTAGGTVTAGGYVMTDATGKALDATSGNRALAFAETGTTTSGDLVRVRLIGRPHQIQSSPPTLLSGDGAIPVRPTATYVVTKASAAALTLAAPTATTDDGVILTITSNTAAAHVITATGLCRPGSASVNVATFAAQKGVSLTLYAYQGKWNTLSQIGVTFS
jgi:hypothetical protein